ncbi:hypothetical protein MGG_05253 [Pyricularia oryzae 70-15]|uniref:CrcB-like protein n=1 Tax=Pyricularia oryzae (strain 70-15 / ATCC MYA-4617 / FGSC 8958) TaxID=242507 RepID=G4N5E6_PYRO7|nr:uncharacterized protein MGG_05253 [Pyricularia oryzae 70-15]EHA53003.1 hypothetical protein MGG_05253 [Pyricularia oryzae 70-15]KAI7920617.1 hypothetical protein M9X92_005813 [Pyricularia oryzae]
MSTSPQPPSRQGDKRPAVFSARTSTELYTISYLILFSLLGTLARLGLQALTTYPGSPVLFPSVWPNLGGSFVIGFLAEDRSLFRARRQEQEEQDHQKYKKTIPLYIGLATGFCGSFTSFSSFIRDVVLTLTNDLGPDPAISGPAPRNGGFSFMAFLAVIIVTVSLSLCALVAGAHFALALQPLLPSVMGSERLRKAMDLSVIILGWGCWIAACLVAGFAPSEVWRGQVLFALVFAPLGCLARFYLSLALNGKLTPSFPVGTFTVNVVGTVVLAVCWDIAHAGAGGIIGCQVLQGLEDGFCGCLTTVSTWVAELVGLAAKRRRDAYIYGATSVVAALAVGIAIMGGFRWSHDSLPELLCVIH